MLENAIPWGSSLFMRENPDLVTQTHKHTHNHSHIPSRPAVPGKLRDCAFGGVCVCVCMCVCVCVCCLNHDCVKRHGVVEEIFGLGCLLGTRPGNWKALLDDFVWPFRNDFK